jgi:hypothetical protein
MHAGRSFVLGCRKILGLSVPVRGTLEKAGCGQAGLILQLALRVLARNRLLVVYNGYRHPFPHWREGMHPEKTVRDPKFTLCPCADASGWVRHTAIGFPYLDLIIPPSPIVSASGRCVCTHVMRK